MEQRKCPECQRWMVLKICHKLGRRWYSAYYQCPGCGVSSTAAVAESRKGAVRALEGLANEEKLIYGRYVEASIDLKPEEEANRALKTYEDYQKLSEALLGRKAGKTAELLEAALRMKRDLEDYKGAGRRYETEIARLKEMATEDILLAARSDYPCDSCVNNTLDVRCDCDNCTDCEHHCTCFECHDSENFVWRGAKEEKPKARGGKLYAYPIILVEEENGTYSVLIPDFGCATCGKDEKEARFKAAECIAGRMLDMRDDNEPFQAPAEMTDGLLRESCINVGAELNVDGGGAVMGDLIERKTIIEAVKNYGKDAISAGRKRLDPVNDIVKLCNTLAALPAVDAAPVAHGRWIPRNDEWFDFFQCSACHVPFWAMRAYCPNCGAKMDGEGDAK